MASRSADLEQAWSTARPGIDRVLQHYDRDIPYKEFMLYYTALYDFCVKPSASGEKSDSGAHHPLLILMIPVIPMTIH